MEKVVNRILVTFTVGFLAIGVVLGIQSVGDCGSVFSPSDSCGSRALAGHLSMVIVFLGLGLTGLVAAVVSDVGPRAEKPEVNWEHPEFGAQERGPDGS
ncbi:MAG: hypothetical protein ACJ72D_30890 [Marmoricola sp.]